MALNEPTLPLRSQLVNRVVQRAVEGDLRKLLIVVGDANRVAHAQLAAIGWPFANERLQERGLSRAIRTDDPQAVSTHDATIEAVDQHSLAHTDVQSFRNRDLVAATLGHLKAQRHRSLVTNGCAKSWQALEQLAAPLGLLAVLAGEVARDVVCLRGDHLLLLVEGALLRQSTFLA